MPRRTARMYYHPYGPDGQWGDETVELQVGDRFSTIAPYSEVMMHMNLAGKPIEVEIVSERAAQIYVDGQQFSMPVTLGEAGIYREGRRRTAAGMTVTAGPWGVQIDDDDYEAMADVGWGGSTAFASRTLMVNGTPVAVERIEASYSVVAQSDDEELNPNLRRPMDYSDVEDESDPRVEWDIAEVTNTAIFDRDEQDILEEGDYDYGYPLYTWLPTKEKAMAEANRLAQSWQGAPWLYSDISPQTEQVALKAASRYGLPF